MPVWGEGACPVAEATLEVARPVPGEQLARREGEPQKALLAAHQDLTPAFQQDRRRPGPPTNLRNPDRGRLRRAKRIQPTVVGEEGPPASQDQKWAIQVAVLPQTPACPGVPPAHALVPAGRYQRLAVQELHR